MLSANLHYKSPIDFCILHVSSCIHSNKLNYQLDVLRMCEKNQHIDTTTTYVNQSMLQVQYKREVTFCWELTCSKIS